MAKHLKGVIFDIDGTLIDSNDAHTRAWIETLASEGFTVPYDRVRKLIGMVGDTLYDIAAAKGAGIATVAVTSGGWTEEGLVGALAIYKNPADILKNFETSPFKNSSVLE